LSEREGRWLIPNSWQWIYAEEIADVTGGGTPSTRDSSNFKSSGDGIPWLTPADLSKYDATYIERGSRDISEKGLISSSAKLMPKGTVLFTSRAPIGYCVIAANEISTNQGFKSLSLYQNISPKLIRFYLLTSKIYAESFASGSTFKELSGKKVAQLKIPLPPLNEQKRIVTKIEALQTRSTAAKEQLQQIKPLLDCFRQSVLAAAFRGDLTKEWRSQNPNIEPAEVLLERIKIERRRRWEEAELEKMKANGKIPKDDNWKKRYKEPEAIDSDGLPELPDSWCWVSVEQFADVGTGATPLRKNTEYYDGGKIPWVTSGALNEIFIETAEEHITPLAIEETNAKVFPKHTLLVAMYGEGKTRGKVSELLIEAATNQACAALILNGLASKIRPIVKLFFLKNYSDIRQIASGGVQPNLNLSMIKRTLVPLPPLNEQIEICSIVEHCMLTAENIEQQYQQAETNLETFNQSILAKAFRGELVPQDPNDEPASVLLARIRTERDQAKPKKSESKKKKSSKKQDKQLGIPGI
jgi:type I restriction enzyme S subunit